MENEIEEILQNYFNEKVDVKVNFVDFCEYSIKLIILEKYNNQFNFSIDNKRTLNANCDTIIEKIESIILNLFKKEGEEND